MKIKKNLNILISILLIFILDRISKEYILSHEQINNGESIVLNSFIKLDLVWNKGIAFGLLSFSNEIFYNIITTIIMLIIGLLIFLILKNNSFKKYSYMLVCGGAFGNVFDRIVHQSVPDFIDLHYNSFHWFIFNIADIFITIGVICLIINEIFLENNKNEKKF